jgi:hypothetical protein
LPNEGVRSRQGLPVRTIHSTASRKSRPSPPVRPGSLGLPRQNGCILSHCASVSTKRSVANSFSESNHGARSRGNSPVLNRL